MSGAEDETPIVLRDSLDGAGFGEWNPAADEHFDEALRQLRDDSGAVERLATVVDRELERRAHSFVRRQVPRRSSNSPARTAVRSTRPPEATLTVGVRIYGGRP